MSGSLVITASLDTEVHSPLSAGTGGDWASWGKGCVLDTGERVVKTRNRPFASKNWRMHLYDCQLSSSIVYCKPGSLVERLKNKINLFPQLLY